MVDTEGPPTKLTKFEMGSQYLEGEVMEESQEEWLSEGILTDDDYNPASQQSQNENSDSMAVTQESQDETIAGETTGESGDQSMGDQQLETETVEQTQDHMTSAEGNIIEETLNNFENSQNNYQAQDLPENMETFLIRKSDGKPIGAEPKESDIDELRKQSDDDDGNDTDDLLRVLGDGDQKDDKKNVPKQKEAETSDDDDEYIFQGSKASANLLAAKNALMRASATKATPEDDVTDCSSDELTAVRKTTVYVSKSAEKNKSNNRISASVMKDNVVRKSHIGQVVKVVQHKPMQSSAPNPAPVIRNKTVINIPVPHNLLRKPRDETSVKKHLLLRKQQDFDEEQERVYQERMTPEQMDEEIPTDPESEDEEDSIYDELPSSDSETLDDWFTIDIRSERAGDYIPLLGDKAYQLLLGEKRRVGSTLQSLRKSLSAMTEGGKQQADKLKAASATLTELDALLKAA